MFFCRNHNSNVQNTRADTPVTRLRLTGGCVEQAGYELLISAYGWVVATGHVRLSTETRGLNVSRQSSSYGVYSRARRFAGPAVVGTGLLLVLTFVWVACRSGSSEQMPANQPASSLVPNESVPNASAVAQTSNDRTKIEWVEVVDSQGNVKSFKQCQTRCLMGVDCNGCNPPGCNLTGEQSWKDRRPIPWEDYGHGEYLGPFRDADVLEYRLRVGDQLAFIYRLTRVESQQPYELNVGDRIRVESLIDTAIDRDLVIQPDGMITLRMLGQVRAARRTVTELQQELEQRYTKYYKVPAITVTPVQVNTRLEDLRAAVDSRYGFTGGQGQQSRVTPEGTIQLPAIGSVPAQGLTLDELKQEIDERYDQIVDGIGVTPRLLQRADRYVYVIGEVRNSGRIPARSSDNRHAGDRTGRRVEQWRKPATNRRLSSHRELAADGHEAGPARCVAGRTPLSGR